MLVRGQFQGFLEPKGDRVQRAARAVNQHEFGLFLSQVLERIRLVGIILDIVKVEWREV